MSIVLRQILHFAISSLGRMRSHLSQFHVPAATQLPTLRPETLPPSKSQGIFFLDKTDSYIYFVHVYKQLSQLYRLGRSLHEKLAMKCLEEIDRLRQAIQTGEYSPGEMLGTEAAFTQQWGMARETVRRGIAALVKEGLVERRPGKGLFVRSPHSATRTIQVLVPNLAWSNEVKIARGAQAAAYECGVQTLLHDSQGDVDRLLETMRRLPDTAFDGAILLTLHDRRFNEMLVHLKSVDFPFVLVDQRLSELEVPTIEIDDYQGAYTVGQNLARLGHRRVIILGPLKLVQDRLNGFRDAMLDTHAYFDRSLIVDLGGNELCDWLTDKVGTAEDTVMSLLDRPDRATAVYDASGDVAVYVYRAARRLGLRIPEDLSVVSFEDSPVSEFLDPDVARLKQPWFEVGRVALEMVVKQMQPKGRGGARMPCEHRVFGFEWIPGASLAPPAKAG